MLFVSPMPHRSREAKRHHAKWKPRETKAEEAQGRQRARGQGLGRVEEAEWATYAAKVEAEVEAAVMAVMAAMAMARASGGALGWANWRNGG